PGDVTAGQGGPVGRVERAAVEDERRELVHRGPDGEGAARELDLTAVRRDAAHDGVAAEDDRRVGAGGAEGDVVAGAGQDVVAVGVAPVGRVQPVGAVAGRAAVPGDVGGHGPVFQALHVEDG